MNQEQKRLVDQRKESLGGSDAAAAVNLSRFKTPFQLWQEKVGAVAPPDLDDNDNVRFGRLLEPVVANEFQRRRGLRVARVNQMLTHPEFPFLTAHIDRRIVGAQEGLECKTAGLRMSRDWGEEHTDDVPEEYLVQSAHYMAVTGYTAWHVAVLIAGNDFRMFRIERDEELIARLIAAEAEFWEYVAARTPPPPSTLEDAAAIWPRDKGTRVLATPEILAEINTLAKLKKDARVLEFQIETAQLHIETFMKDRTSLMATSTEQLATWKAQTARRIDTNMLRQKYPDIAAECERVSETRVFRLK